MATKKPKNNETDEAAAEKAAAEKILAETAAAEKAAAETAAVEQGEKILAEKKGFFVAEGKSLTTKRGLLDAGDPVEAACFARGEDQIAEFVKSGHIVKN